MNDSIIIQRAHPGAGYDKMMELTEQRHSDYCKRHSFDFWHDIYDDKKHDYMTGEWAKIDLILKAMEKGYTYIAWLDADTLIYDLNVDLRKAFEENKIGACWHRIPQLHHWNVGAMYIHNTDETRIFMKRWLSHYPLKENDGWNEQGVFNHMARETKLVSTVSDKWNATLNVSMVPDAVVLGFHGIGSPLEPVQRFNAMQQVMSEIARKQNNIRDATSRIPQLESAEAAQGDKREVIKEK